MTDQELDVVVLGGGGHVGLPLSLVLREGRAARRDLRHEPRHPRPDRRRRDAVHGDRRGRPAPRAAADRSARAQRRRRNDPTDRAAHRRRRHAGRRVPRAVDDDLRADSRSDRAAPARRCARRAAQHGLSGHDWLRPPASGGAQLQRRRRLLPRADRGGPRARGVAHAAADRRGPTTRAPATARTRLFRVLVVEDGSNDDQGSRAGEALHEHVAVHEVRGRQSVPDDRGPGRRGLHERPQGHPRGLPARIRSARTGICRRTVPVQGRDAARCVHE